MRQIEFFKYHALENDFLVIDSDSIEIRKRKASERSPRLLLGSGKAFSRLVAALCNRHRGIGADGAMIYTRSRERFLMRLFNADGSEAEVSGNGLRILAHHIYRNQRSAKKAFMISSASGDHPVKVISSKGDSVVTRISLQAPRFALPDVPMMGESEFFIAMPFAVAAGELIGTAVSVGNPHLVFFVDSSDFDWQTFGSQVECDPRFPQRTNVEFAVVETKRRVTHWSWERGVGVTRASGTGAASTVAAGIINGLLEHQVTVCEPAGVLQVSLASLNDNILLTGPSTFVGQGRFVFDDNEKNTR